MSTQPAVDPADIALAADIVRTAGLLAAKMRTEGLAAQQKTSAADIVTAADQQAEQLTVARLGTERPADSILGEEGTNVVGTSGRQWVIDPVDGTYNFFSGLTYWCSAIALRDEHGVLLGAIYHPHDDVLWVGGPGVPTTRNGQPLPTLPDRPLANSSVASYLNPGRINDPQIAGPFGRAVAGAAALRMLGSGSMDLAAVADGRIGCWFQVRVDDWDWLPGKALVDGVGGHTEQVEADGYLWSIAGPPTAVRQVRQKLHGS